MPTPSDGRVTDDRCPGALRVHQAADGAMVRVRLPGGQITVGQLRALAAASASDGDRSLDLTSRANVQIRGIADAAAATGAAEDAGARVLAPPTTTPWNSSNARLEAPAGLQITLFAELGESD